MTTKPNPEFLQLMLSGAQAEYEADVKQAERRCSARITEVYQWWLSIGGSEEDLGTAPKEVDVPSTIKGTAVRKTQTDAAKINGSGGRTLSKAVVWKYVKDVLTDPDITLVTQTEVKDRVLRDYPDAKLPSVRSEIANQLRELTKGKNPILELAEVGKAGAPNKYRKNMGQAEETENVEETQEFVLRSGP